MKNALTDFQWTPEAAAEAVIHELVDAFVARSPLAAKLRERMLHEAGVRFSDLVDHIRLAPSTALIHRLHEAGFREKDAEGAREGDSKSAAKLFVQERGLFPAVMVDPIAPGCRLAIKVESVADFESVWQTGGAIRGNPLAPVRIGQVWKQGDDELWTIERHGSRGFDFEQPVPRAETVLRHADAFRRRPRRGNEAEGFATAGALIDAAINDLGANYACDVWFAAERDYWQRRNRAGQVQKARQDRLGLGWANHDHHTYRSSRRRFATLIGLLERLGCHCRERFYAGREAGWGAQVLEQPEAGIVIFADVDLSPDELSADFSHELLPERKELGTVGLWCGLHGESFLQAGLHHLECQFDFAALSTQLASEAGVKVMKPFTDFPYLRQAFTEGERWEVEPERIKRLQAEGRISAAQGAAFEREGAIGSHLENLERNAGFKGFNQTGVSEIISATDPRKHLEGPESALR